MTDLLGLDALTLSAQLARRKVSAVELMQATLTRIAAVNPGLNAIVNLRDADTLLAEAATADQTPRKGWLHGIPFAIKDLADAQGLPTTQGSPAFAGSVAAGDDLMVQRIRAAGAIIIGKTNTPEFGLGSHTFNPVFGPTRNAFDPTKSAGGSSGGAAVALASGMVCVADGSDMMGSLRNPAGWNNVYGFRPTWGRVPAEPEGDSFLHQLSTNGPMARNPADIAALLDTMAGPDPRLPLAMPYDAMLPQINAPVTGRRIGWLGDWGGAYPMETGILTTCTMALEKFTALGCTVTPVAAPFPANLLWQSWITLRSWAVAASLGPLLDQGHGLKPEAQWEIEQGRALSASAIHAASTVRSDWFRACAKLFNDYDALILPSAQVWPFPIDWRWPQSIGGVTMDTYHRWMEVVVPVSLIGLPCLCVPAGFGPTGLPIGLQLIGRRGVDAGVLQLGQAWHQIAN